MTPGGMGPGGMTPGGMTQVAEAVADAGLRLVRAWPRDAGHLLLDLAADRAGARVAGQWFSDGDRARHVAERTAGARLVAPGVLTQPGGADRRLTCLRRLVVEPGAQLVAHRPERRAVVRRTGSDGGVEFTKVVRPDRLPSVLAAAQGSAVPGVRVPRVTSVDAERGFLTTAAVPGRTVHEVLADPTVKLRQLVSVGRSCGVMVRALHDAAPSAPSLAGPRHDPLAELAVARAWAGRAREHCALDPDSLGDLERRLALVAGRLPARPAGTVRLHRDLHDKQVLVELHGQVPPVALIDFDLAAVGDPALDLANLLVHLHLRSLQGHADADRARACADAVLDAYRPTPAVRATLPAYEELARLRLVGVYAFRPAQRGVVPALLRAA